MTWLDDPTSALHDVRAVVARQMGLEVESVSAGLRLSEDLHIDSLEMQDLLLTLESRFGSIPSAERMAGVRTVQDLCIAILGAGLSGGAR